MFHLALQLVLYLTYADCSETHLLFSLPNAIKEMLSVVRRLTFLRQFWQLKDQTYGRRIFTHMLCSFLQLVHNIPATGILPHFSYFHLPLWHLVYITYVYSPSAVSIKYPQTLHFYSPTKTDIEVPLSCSQDLKPSPLQYIAAQCCHCLVYHLQPYETNPFGIKDHVLFP